MRSLDKKWKELLFAFSGFGPNLLMVIMGSYFSDAMNPAALESGEAFQAIMPGVCFVMPMLFPILLAIGKAFDGIIDIPLAHLTDSMSTKWGKRRPAIAIAFFPMVISYVLCWIPIGGEEQPLFNTIWVSTFAIIFFAAYTMALIAFYGSLSHACDSEDQRTRVSSYKSFFDTITYCLTYALVPVILSACKIHINTLVFALTPLMCTMLIPLIMIKEGKKYGYPELAGGKAEKVNLFKSIKITFTNRSFRNWLLVNGCTFFGLQMFLSSMNGLIIGGMGLNGTQMAILNTCAFAPVPLMLYLFKKVKARFGVRSAYQSCLITFAIAIMTFFIGSRFILGEGNVMLKMIIGCIGGASASWSIGTFFMMSYLVPSQISSVEERLTGRNHSAMYFAGNAVVSSIVGALSGSLIYEYVKNVFITKDFKFVFASTPNEAFIKLMGLSEDYTVSAAEAASVFNFGNLIVPFIVATFCILGFFVAFLMPRDYSAVLVARDMKKQDPSLDISEIEAEDETVEKGEIIFVQLGLWALSGS
ncbi:MAG: MFS transporter, partial [Clostridia bacterium]|nr:MFS transporter [Clostridia bacterium]